MDVDNSQALFTIVNQLGIAGTFCAVVFVVGLLRGWWVMGAEHRRMADRETRLIQREEEWRQLTMRSQDSQKDIMVSTKEIISAVLQASQPRTDVTKD